MVRKLINFSLLTDFVNILSHKYISIVAIKEEYIQFIKEQLSDFGEVEMKKMFGGIGIFKEGIMFGMIGYGAFRLKVDKSNEANYVNKGMKPFKPDPKKKGMPYWEVPIEVLEDRTLLKDWATLSYEIARKKSKRK